MKDCSSKSNNNKEELKNQDEIKIVKLVRSVKKKKCEKSFHLIMEYVRPYIDGFARNYKIPGCDEDEIEQECLFALRYKAIEDFDAKRGKFRSFAILCIKRHLFSLIKGNNQHKRRVLNESISLNEERWERSDNFSLTQLITKDTPSVSDQTIRDEVFQIRKERLLSKLSKLEQEVFILYIQQYRYEEIVKLLKKVFPKKNISKKTIDNSLVRARQKARELIGDDYFNDV